MSKDYDNFVERMGSFDMELPDIRTPSKPTNYTKVSNNEIRHYGVLGMHWGRRSSGSNSGNNKPARKKMTEGQLNAAKNVSSTSSTITKEGLNVHKSISDIRKTKHQEDLSKLTDDELKTKIARLDLEQKYNGLTGNKTSKGESYARSTLEITGSVLAIGSSAIGIALAMKQLKGA